MITLRYQNLAVWLSSIIFFLCCSYLLYQAAQHRDVPHHDVDSKAYQLNATFFQQQKTFAPLGGVPYYALGYALWMGLLYSVFGNQTRVIIIAQVILAIFCSLIMFILMRRLFDQRAAYIAAWLFACNLGFLVFAQFVLTEILLAFLLLLFFERFIMFMQTGYLIPLWSSAIALGLSMIVKPVAIYYPLCLMPCIIWTLYDVNWRKRSFIITLFCLLFYLPVAGYRLHNKIVFATFKFCSFDQENMMFWYLPHVLAAKHGTTSDYERTKLKQLEHRWGVTMLKSWLWEQVSENPGLALYAWLKNVMKTWCGLYSANLKLLADPSIFSGQYSFFRMQGSWYQRAYFYVYNNTQISWIRAVAVAECVWQLVRYPLIIAGLLLLWQQGLYQAIWIFCSYLIYFSMITGHDGCARFRMMFEIPLIMLAALGLSGMIMRKGDGREECIRRNFSRWRGDALMAAEQRKMS